MAINNVPAAIYHKFMGRYSTLLSPLLVVFAGLSTVGVGVGVGDSGVRVLAAYGQFLLAIDTGAPRLSLLRLMARTAPQPLLQHQPRSRKQLWVW